MYFKLMKKIIKYCILSIIILINFTSFSNATIAEKISADMNSDGIYENVCIYHMAGRREDSSYAVSINDSNDKVISDDVVFLENHIMRLSNFKVIDIDPNDNQKEIIVEIMGDSSSEAEVISCDNNFKLKYLGKIDTWPASATKGYTVNKKLKQLEVLNNSRFPIRHTFYSKYKIVDGKLKNVTTNERNIYQLDGKNIVAKCGKSIKVLNKKMNKKIFTLAKGENITILSTNSYKTYLKVKNSKGKIGYIPTVYNNESSYVKQYPYVNIYNIFTDLPIW